MNSSKITATLALLVIALVGVAAGRSLMARGVAFAPQVEERRKGNPAAPVKIVEYYDYQCGACAYAAAQVKLYLQKYPDQIYLEANFFPLAGHPHGQTSALYAYCAQQQGKFWAYHDLLFDRQGIWNSLGDAKPYFTASGGELGMDEKALDACVANPETAAKVSEIRKSGEARGVISTPTFFVNGKMMVGLNAFVREMDERFPREKQTSSAQSPAAPSAS